MAATPPISRSSSISLPSKVSLLIPAMPPPAGLLREVIRAYEIDTKCWRCEAAISTVSLVREKYEKVYSHTEHDSVKSLPAPRQSASSSSDDGSWSEEPVPVEAVTYRDPMKQLALSSISGIASRFVDMQSTWYSGGSYLANSCRKCGFEQADNFVYQDLLRAQAEVIEIEAAKQKLIEIERQAEKDDAEGRIIKRDERAAMRKIEDEARAAATKKLRYRMIGEMSLPQPQAHDDGEPRPIPLKYYKRGREPADLLAKYQATKGVEVSSEAKKQKTEEKAETVEKPKEEEKKEEKVPAPRKYAWNCEHKDKLASKKGLCSSCYTKERKEAKKQKEEQEKGAKPQSSQSQPQRSKNVDVIVLDD